jgi:hypothetical protein
VIGIHYYVLQLGNAKGGWVGVTEKGLLEVGGGGWEREREGEERRKERVVVRQERERKR